MPGYTGKAQLAARVRHGRRQLRSLESRYIKQPLRQRSKSAGVRDVLFPVLCPQAKANTPHRHAPPCGKAYLMSAAVPSAFSAPLFRARSAYWCLSERCLHTAAALCSSHCAIATLGSFLDQPAFVRYNLDVASHAWMRTCSADERRHEQCPALACGLKETLRSRQQQTALLTHATFVMQPSPQPVSAAYRRSSASSGSPAISLKLCAPARVLPGPTGRFPRHRPAWRQRNLAEPPHPRAEPLPARQGLRPVPNPAQNLNAVPAPDFWPAKACPAAPGPAAACCAWIGA